MMGAAEIITELRTLGVEILVEGERLRWRPRNAVPPALRKEIVQNKAALIALLTGPSGPNGPRAMSAAPNAARDHEAVADGHPVWVILPGGYPEKVYTIDRIPPDATSWCREGDKEWQPIQRALDS